MKSILQSIKPQYCELIASGKKTIEVRKTRPKLDLPFKVYIYCTKDNSPFLLPTYSQGGLTDSDIWQRGNGKVIGEYVCDEIVSFGFTPHNHGEYMLSGNANSKRDVLKESCLSFNEMYEYIGEGGDLYALHITDVKLYNKPKELSEFGKECNLDCPSVRCPYWKYQRVNTDEWDYDCSCNNIRPLTRPPQSWCYAEEV